MRKKVTIAVGCLFAVVLMQVPNVKTVNRTAYFGSGPCPLHRYTSAMWVTINSDFAPL
jgi:hypothetical protein